MQIWQKDGILLSCLKCFDKVSSFFAIPLLTSIINFSVSLCSSDVLKTPVFQNPDCRKISVISVNGGVFNRKFSMAWLQWIYAESLKSHRNLSHRKYFYRKTVNNVYVLYARSLCTHSNNQIYVCIHPDLISPITPFLPITLYHPFPHFPNTPWLNMHGSFSFVLPRRGSKFHAAMCGFQFIWTPRFLSNIIPAHGFPYIYQEKKS